MVDKTTNESLLGEPSPDTTTDDPNTGGDSAASDFEADQFGEENLAELDGDAGEVLEGEEPPETPEPEEVDADKGEKEDRLDDKPEETGEEGKTTETGQEPVKTPTLDELRSDMETKLVSAFQLSEEDALRLQQEPEKFLPQMFAKATTQAIDMVMSGIGSMLPQMIDHTQQVNRTLGEVRTKFYTDFPSLNKPEYKPVLDRVAATLAADPSTAKMSREEFLDELGVVVSTRLRIPLPDKFRSSQEEERIVRRDRPARTARPVVTKPSTTRVEDDNEFAQLADDVDDD